MDALERAMIEFEHEVLQQLSLLEAELKGMAERRKLIEAKILGLRMFLSPADLGGPVTFPSTGSVVVGSPDVPKTAVKDQVIDFALRILGDGKPRHTSMLLREFANAGIEVGGNNKLASVSSILSRDGRFKANRSVGWTLTKRESLAANEAFDLQPTP